jgi:hypothetical protein
MAIGDYEFNLDVADYFRSLGVKLPSRPFLNEAPIRFYASAAANDRRRRRARYREEAARLLLRGIKSPKVRPESTILSPKLVFHSSCGARPAI